MVCPAAGLLAPCLAARHARQPSFAALRRLPRAAGPDGALQNVRGAGSGPRTTRAVRAAPGP